VYLLNENLNNQDSSFYFLTIYTLLLLLESCGDPGKIPLILFVLPAAERTRLLIIERSAISGVMRVEMRR
jgi:hypothetical protein